MNQQIDGFHQAYCQGLDSEDPEQKIKKQDTKNLAVIVTGEALITIENRKSKAQKFVSLGKLSRVVIACRVSPSQKAVIVKMIRESVGFCIWGLVMLHRTKN